MRVAGVFAATVAAKAKKKEAATAAAAAAEEAYFDDDEEEEEEEEMVASGDAESDGDDDEQMRGYSVLRLQVDLVNARSKCEGMRSALHAAVHATGSAYDLRHGALSLALDQGEVRTTGGDGGGEGEGEGRGEGEGVGSLLKPLKKSPAYRLTRLLLLHGARADAMDFTGMLVAAYDYDAMVFTISACGRLVLLLLLLLLLLLPLLLLPLLLLLAHHF
jgi:hypothetical protein